MFVRTKTTYAQLEHHFLTEVKSSDELALSYIFIPASLHLSFEQDAFFIYFFFCLLEGEIMLVLAPMSCCTLKFRSYCSITWLMPDSTRIVCADVKSLHRKKKRENVNQLNQPQTEQRLTTRFEISKKILSESASITHQCWKYFWSSALGGSSSQSALPKSCINASKEG